MQCFIVCTGFIAHTGTLNKQRIAGLDREVLMHKNPLFTLQQTMLKAGVNLVELCFETYSAQMQFTKLLKMYIDSKGFQETDRKILM